MRVSNNTAHEALRAWAEWYKEDPAVKANVCGVQGSTFDRAADDPKIPWKVLIVDGALSNAATMRGTAMRLYMRMGPMHHQHAKRREKALLEYVAWALSDADSTLTIAQAAIIEARDARSG